VLWTMWKIIHLVIERPGIQSDKSFRTVKIEDVAYKRFNNLSVYSGIRDKFSESNDMLSNILTV
jgi:hypothetical protein